MYLILGKRGWKESNNGDGDDSNRRTVSNSIYRDHRLSEIETEAAAVKNICQKSIGDGSLAARGLARRFATRLVILSGGGTTVIPDGTTSNGVEENYAESKCAPRLIQRGMMNSTYFSFGLAAAVEKLEIPMKDDVKELTQKDCNRILGGIGLQGGIIQHDGTLDLHRMFACWNW